MSFFSHEEENLLMINEWKRIKLEGDAFTLQIPIPLKVQGTCQKDLDVEHHKETNENHYPQSI